MKGVVVADWSSAASFMPAFPQGGGEEMKLAKVCASWLLMIRKNG